MLSEPYPELDAVLERFTAGAQNALKENFVGAYLIGSLASGDFDLDSDVDFLIVTNVELSDTELRSLQALHIEIHDLDCYPAKHLEGSYISRGLLTRPDLVGVQPLWYVDNGSTLLQRSVHDNRLARSMDSAGARGHPHGTQSRNADTASLNGRIARRNAHFHFKIKDPLCC